MINTIKNTIFDVNLESFTLFAEYFIVVSALYFTVALTSIRANIWKANLQKAISECFALILLLACCLIINDDVLFFQNLSFNNSIINGPLTFFSKLVICVSSSAFFFIIADFLNDQKLVRFEYLLILLFSILGLLLLCSSFDLLTSYLSIELISLSSYLLAAFRKDSLYSVEAGLKYFVIGSISSAFFLLGTTFIYASCGSIYFIDFWDLYYNDSGYHPTVSQDLTWEGLDVIYRAICININWYCHFNFDESSYTFVKIGLVLILFSLFIKLALAPFHLWSLDVYEGSPTATVFFFAAITKLSFFIFLIRFCHMGMLEFKDEWQFYFIVIALISVFVGSVGGLTQYKLKTLLAYSSISHMGYSVLALSTGSLYGVQILLFYLVIYILSGVCTWHIFMLLKLKNPYFVTNKKYSKELADLSQLHKANPALAFGFSITMFSLAGLPPLIGFLTKFGVFLALLKENFYLVCVFAMLCSVVSTFYYIRIVKVIYFENITVGKLYYPIKTNKTILLSFFIFLLLFLFVNPSLLFLIIHAIVNNFC